MSVQDLDTKDREPYAQGCEARKAGNGEETNPYANTDLRARCAWFAGYHDTDVLEMRKKNYHRRGLE